MARDLVLDLSPTQSAFVHSNAEIVQLCGPMGEGKTYAGVVAPVVHAARCGCNIRGAIIRDTHQNLKMSTVGDFKEVYGEMCSVHDDAKRMVIHSSPQVELFLFGAADEGALAKFQSLIVSYVHLEEPAPVQERANAGLPRSVFEMSVARASRQTGTKMRVQITQNPADEDHWTESLFYEPEIYARDPQTGATIRKECFRIPYGDNKYLNAHTRAANIAAFQNDPGKFARYVEGVAAPVQRGSAVTPTYNKKIHFSEIELPVFEGGIGVRLWDSWHSPVCLVGQFLPPGKLIIHDVVMGDNCGVAELIPEQVKPLLAGPKYKGKIHEWRDIGDPTMAIPDQSTKRQGAAKTVEQLLKTRFEGGPAKIRNRLDAITNALSIPCRDGSPRVYLSKTAHYLHRCLNGGWHWKVDNNKKIIGTSPVKDEFSHPADALAYGCGVLLPVLEKSKAKSSAMAAANAENMRLAMSYGHSHAGGGM